MKRIAVAIVHGIEINDPDFAKTPTELLLDGFAAAIGKGGPDPEDALVVEPVPWAAYLEPRERRLYERMYPEDGQTGFDRYLTSWVKKVDGGSVMSLLPLILSTLCPTLPRLSTLHYPTARWLMAHFVGDALAYDRGASPENYAQAHEALAHGLANLARRAGSDAPLCVLAHSFGSVLVTDYLYDEQESAKGRHDLVPDLVRRARGHSPLARGETLSWLFTMGSPLALWSLRYPEARLDRPAQFPGTGVAARFPQVRPEWVNLYDKGDLFGYPLRPLDKRYRELVTQDRPVRLREFPVAGTPLAHPFYWTDRDVMKGVARTLAQGWRQLQQPRTGRLIAEPSAVR